MPKLKKPKPTTPASGADKHDARKANATAPAEQSRIAHHFHRNVDIDSGVENLDKVRDILFGSNIRAQEVRFGKIEQQVARETTGVRDEARKRLDTVETFLKRGVQSILERVKAEQTQRGDSITGLTRDLKEVTKTLGQKLAEARQQTEQSQRELWREMQNQARQLREDLQRARSETIAEFQAIVNEIRGEKVDRSSLADIFTEMAARLGVK